MNGPSPMCMFCRHFIGGKKFAVGSANYPGGWVCAAFPDGIPDPIASGGVLHYEPVPGDSGIVFEQKPTGPKYVPVDLSAPFETYRKP